MILILSLDVLSKRCGLVPNTKDLNDRDQNPKQSNNWLHNKYVVQRFWLYFDGMMKYYTSFVSAFFRFDTNSSTTLYSNCLILIHYFIQRRSHDLQKDFHFKTKFAPWFQISIPSYLHCLKIFEIQQKVQSLGFGSLACHWLLLTFFHPLWYLYPFMYNIQRRLCHTVVGYDIV